MPGEDNDSGKGTLYRTASNSVTGSPRLGPTPSRNTDNMESSGRENRPPPTPGSAGYGSIAPQEPGSATDNAQSANRQDGARPAPPARQPMSRRSSSTYVGPRRGQNFSTDDAADEYESDTHPRQSTKNTGFGPNLRRQTSNLRRRQTMQAPSLTLPRVDSSGEEENQASSAPKSAPHHKVSVQQDETTQTSGEETLQGEDADAEEDDDDDVSDAESFTLKDRQQAINQTHPFGIRIWKPALYKKNRSVEKSAEGDIHSAPGGRVNRWLWFFNLVWTVLFGWWLAIIVSFGAITCFVFGFAPDAAAYGRLLAGLAVYIFYPFGRFVKLEQDEAYAEEDEGDGRSITEYEQWQSGDLEGGRLFFGPVNSAGIVGRQRAGSIESADENDSLLGNTRSGRGHDDSDDGNRRHRRARLFGRGQWTFGRVLFFIFFYFLIAPCLLFVSGICWFMVFWIPMGRTTALVFHHLRRHPLALSFHSDASYSRGPSSTPSSILLCTYRAVGLKYWKYTVDGTNIFLINLIGVVLFTIFDYFILYGALELKIWLTHPGLLFCLGLFSIIPLAYFIGQAVASISAQSSMGVGAAINAFFSTVVEVFLYCVALNEGKAQLVEGSIIGSIFAGILFLPGLSMCFGAVRRKTQRFNVKSAGVTSTMLLFAVIAAFGPTLFYQIYGSHELNCHACTTSVGSADTDCRRCFFSQVPAVNDRFFVEAVQPFCWFAAVLLFVSYLLGLWFTLRTHAAVIWNDIDEKKPGAPALNGIPHGTVPTVSHHAVVRKPSASNIPTGPLSAVKESPFYQRILGQSLKQIGLDTAATDGTLRPPQPEDGASSQASSTPHLVPPKEPKAKDPANFIEGLSAEQNEHLVRQVAEVAATAATVAARDAYRSPRLLQNLPAAPSSTAQHSLKKTMSAPGTVIGDGDVDHGAHEGGGHDAPNWSRLKSTVILLGATFLYAIIAEILVKTVEFVLENIDIDEKFLGITLFALVPNTTEFLNAISFAMNGNIALSMEIGSAYALQVCLLQIPALVLYSAFYSRSIDPADLINHTFNLIFPQWDMVTVILCVFLLSYVYGEGKSNYFKGGILVLAYLVIVVGFYLSGFSGQMYANGIDRFELMGSSSDTFKTIGRSTSGQAF